MPKKMPIELLAERHKGKISKATIEKRRSEEPVACADNLLPPAFLNKKQREQFNTYAEQLKRLKIIDNIDADALAMYVVAYSLYIKATKELLKKDKWSNDTALRVQNKYFEQCQKCAKELGMTISSRCRLVVPKIEKKEPEKASPFMEMFGS